MSRLVRAEFRKLFTTRLWWGMLLGVVAASAALALLQSFVIGLDADGDGTGGVPVDDPGALRFAYTAGVGIAYLFTLSIGVIAMAGEKRHQTLSASVLAVPRRWRLVVAKAVAVTGLGLLYGVVTIVASVVAAVIVLSARGIDLWNSEGSIPRAMVLGVVAVALWGLIGLGVGTLISNQVVALLVAIGVAWIIEPIIGFALNALGAGGVAQFLPGSATTALTSPPAPEGVDLDILPWWGGGLVLVAYVLISAGIGAALTLRRDIT